MELDVNSIGTLVMAYGLKIIIGIAIFFVGKFIVRKLADFAAKVMQKSKLDKTLISFAEDVIFALGIVVAAGIMIILFRPFKVGDYIEAGGTEGDVEDISIFTTIFATKDNKKVIVPNNEITSGIITNYSAKRKRRIDLVIGVGYDDDLAKTKKILTKVASAHKSVLKTPELQVAVAELGDSSVNLVVRPWVKTNDYWDVRFDLTEQIKVALDKEGISIPYPQRDLHIISGNVPVAKKTASGK